MSEPFKKKFDISFHFLDALNSSHVDTFRYIDSNTQLTSSRTVVEQKIYASTMMSVVMNRHAHLYESFLSEFAADSTSEVQPVLLEEELRHMGTAISLSSLIY